MVQQKTWKDIFGKFLEGKKIKDYSYKSLLIAAGHYSSKSGGFKVRDWLNECKQIETKLNLKDNSNILEIGSGSGALLKYFYKKNKVYGIDYSKELLSLSKKALPKGKFKIGEANHLTYNNSKFQAVLMQSCIQYFLNKKYFLKVISESKRTLSKNGKLFIGEIVDKDCYIDFLIYRKKNIGYSNFKKLYHGKKNSKLKFFSLSRDEIIKFLKKDFKNFEIYNCVKRGNEKEYYRFNLVCTKK